MIKKIPSSDNADSSRSFLERCYTDSKGRVSLLEAPNFPITVWAVCRIALLFLPKNGSTIYHLLDVVAFGALFTWAWLELSSGVNYLRRLLGLIVIIVTTIGHI